MAPDSGLVPESYSEFRSVAFWDGFFKTRGDKAFEWYGDWKQLQHFIKPLCARDQKILVPGCGNSDMSANMYDSGFQQITNLDFSKLVVMNMMKSNLRKRPIMKWLVGDMTHMKFADNSFDLVIDKGGLDALMGEDVEEGSEAGQKFLSEVQRVLSEGGSYICISLLQSHVLTLLLAELSKNWQLSFEAVPPTPDMARAPLQPMFMSAKRRRLDENGKSAVIQSSVKISPKAPNAEQLSEICQVLQEHTTTPERSNGPECNGKEAKMGSSGLKSRNQESSEDDFKTMHPGRRVLVDLTVHREESSGHKKDGSQKGGGDSRFLATVLDASDADQRLAAQECCVFMVPQGRESEWLFAVEEGQRQIAKQCQCKRLILVSLGRGHKFGSSEQVQKELSPLVRGLAPKKLRSVKKGIPILTCQDGVGKRKVLCSVNSSISGQVVVEDVQIQDGSDDVQVRRLIFVSNTSLIQSEARLLNGTEAEAIMTSARQSTGQAQPNKYGSEIDFTKLCMGYHKHIIAGLLAGGCIPERPCPSDKFPKGLIIGLGGGLLAEFLCQHLHSLVHAVELDPEIVRLAKDYFSLQEKVSLKRDTSVLQLINFRRPQPKIKVLQVEVADGLSVVSSLAREHNSEEKIDFLIVDAGSSDSSLAMSCPPPAFLQSTFLQDAREVLKESGMLIVNCVTRSEKAFAEAISSIQAEFPSCAHTDVEDDVNRVIFASRKDIRLDDQHAKNFDFPAVLQNYSGQKWSQKFVDELASDLAEIEFS